jgi:hypothetical protein
VESVNSPVVPGVTNIAGVVGNNAVDLTTYLGQVAIKINGVQV